MSKNLLTFVNHACVHIANDNTLLLIDPWVEGPVFNNGWSLLDNTTSNAALVHELNTLRLNTFIWFSHEHPDHFSVPFIKRLRKDFTGKLTLLFQHTKDKRVVTFLRNMQFDVIECLPGKTVHLDPSLDITVFPYADGDAYCLVGSAGRYLLNLNDCAVSSTAQCREVQASIAHLCPRVDLLLTQFGYANWVGNPDQPELRRAAADEKRDRIRLQMAILAPRIGIPFASFVTFSSVDNHYLNDHQNQVRPLLQWSRLTAATSRLRFVKPGDSIDLAVDTPESLAWASDLAVEHWERLAALPAELLPAEAARTLADVTQAVDAHRKAMRANLLMLPWLLEKLGLIHPLVIRLPDLDLAIRASYVQICSTLDAHAPFDISLTSSSAVFLFTNPYGFNTTHVNGRFRTGRDGALLRFSRFFMPQNLGRQGYGVSHPLATLHYLAANVLARCLAFPSRKRGAQRAD